MKKIMLFTTKAEAGCGYTTTWSTDNGKNVEGLHVTVPTNVRPSDALAVAELSALRHLLLVRGVFPKHRSGKIAIALSVKGAAEPSTNATRTWSRFLKIRYPTAKIRLATRFGWAARHEDIRTTESITATAPAPERIYNPFMGTVTVTIHAVDKVAKHYPDTDDPFRVLKNLIMGARVLERVEV